MKQTVRLIGYIIAGMGAAFPITVMFMMAPILLAALLGNKNWFWSATDAALLLVAGVLVGGVVGGVLAVYPPKQANDARI